MKKLLYSISAFLIMGGLATSCLDDTLDVESKSTFDSSVVFSNYQLAEYAIFGIGEVFAHTNSYNARLNCYYGYNTDIEVKMGSKISGAKVEEYTLAEYDTDISNASLNTSNNGYNEIMIGVERANLAIEGLRLYGNVNSDADMRYLLGEALTYRALYYLELVKMWGEVPLHREPLTSETLYAPKDDRDDIYKSILSDLEEAAEYLYWPFESTQTSRADRMNKAFALGLYARAAMAAAGYSWRPDDGTVGTGNLGSLRLSTDESLSKEALYPKALEYLEQIITSGTLSLETSYESLWRKFNNFSHVTDSREVMFVQPFGDARNRWNYAHAYPHTANSPYIGDKASKGGMTGPLPTLWWKYEKQDVRRDITCVPMRWNYEAYDGAGGWEMRNCSYWYWGKYRYEWMVDYPGGTGDGCKPIMMRYSDVYLMAAEIAAWEGNIDKARQYLQTVRNRAYPGNENLVTAYVNSLSIGSASGSDNAAISDYNTEGTIMKAIIDERALEFAGEFYRKQDLIRWGLLKTKMDAAAADLKDFAYMEGAYSAYAPYTVVKKESTSEIEYNVYCTYYRQKTDGSEGIEFFGLEPDEIGRVPSDYTDLDDGGWIKLNYLSDYYFYNSNGGAYGEDAAYRWNYLYNNGYNDPYPRSVWPLFGLNLSNAQGSLVNDYGYANL